MKQYKHDEKYCLSGRNLKGSIDKKRVVIYLPQKSFYGTKSECNL